LMLLSKRYWTRSVGNWFKKPHDERVVLQDFYKVNENKNKRL
jgi:hypothetical protein